LEVHRVGQAPIRADVVDVLLVEARPQEVERLTGDGDGDVLDTSVRLLGGAEPEAGEVEEGEQVVMADVEEDVRRPGIVTVLHGLDEWEAEEVLVELDRPVDVAADEGEVVDSLGRGGGTELGRPPVSLPDLGQPGLVVAHWAN